MITAKNNTERIKVNVWLESRLSTINMSDVKRLRIRPAGTVSIQRKGARRMACVILWKRTLEAVKPTMKKVNTRTIWTRRMENSKTMYAPSPVESTCQRLPESKPDTLKPG